MQVNAPVTRPGEELALQGPTDVDDAYQVFDNGVLGGFGDFTAKTPVAYDAQPKCFRCHSYSGAETPLRAPAGARSPPRDLLPAVDGA